MAINVDFASNVKDVIKGTENIADALDDVSDNLKDLGKDGEKLDDKISQAFKGMADEARTSGKSMGKSVKDGTDKAGEGLQDMKSEAASTAKETAASFSSIEDAAGALQEVAANAFAAFGPAGMAAGLVAAAGIGLATSALQGQADQINTNKERMLDLVGVIRDNGGVLTEADYIKNMDEYGLAIQDTKEWFEIFQEDAISGFEKIRKWAQDTGLSTKQIFEGGFSDSEKAKQTLDLVNKKLSETKDRAAALYNLDGSIEPVDSSTITSLEEYKKKVEDNIKAQDTAKQIEQERKRSIEGTTAALRENIEAQEKQSDAVKGSISSELDYLDSQEALAAKLAESGNAWDKNTAAGRDNQRAVLDIANGIEDMAKAAIDAGDPVDAVTAKFNAQKDALINQVAPAFGGSQEAARQYIEQVLKTPPTATTKVELQGQEEVRKKLDGLAAPVRIPLRPDFDDNSFQGMLAKIRNTSVSVNVTPRSGTPLVGP